MDHQPGGPVMVRDDREAQGAGDEVALTVDPQDHAVEGCRAAPQRTASATRPRGDDSAGGGVPAPGVGATVAVRSWGRTPQPTAASQTLVARADAPAARRASLQRRCLIVMVSVGHTPCCGSPFVG